MIAGVSVPPELFGLGAVLGLGYGLLACGLIISWRASRVLNLAHGQIGAAAGAVLAVLVIRNSVPYWAAFVVVVLGAGGAAALMEVTVVRRLREAPPVIALVATLGVAQCLFFLTRILSAQLPVTAAFPQPSGLPSTRLGALLLTPAAMALVVLAPLLITGLWLLMRRSRLGLAMRASGINADGARMLGVPAGRMRSLSWAIAGGLAAITATFLLGFGSSVTADALGPRLLIRALAAASIAGMASLPLALASGVAIGVVEEAVAFNSTGFGPPDLCLLVIALAAAMFRGAGRRSEPMEAVRWRAVARWRPLPAAARVVPLVRSAGPAAAVGCLAVAVLVPAVVDRAALIPLLTIVGAALVGLSAWTIAAWTGEAPLGQFAIAGIGAVVAVRVTNAAANGLYGLLAGSAAGAVAGAAVAMPSRRSLSLPMISLAFAVACETWLLPRPWALGNGVRAHGLSIGGLSLDGPRGATELGLVVFALAAIALSRSLRLGLGRRTVAARDGPMTAAAFGVGAWRTRLTTHALAGAIAGIAGVITAFGLQRVSVASFTASAGFNALAIAAVGGLGTVLGPALGALLIAGIPALVHSTSAALAGTAFGWLLVLLAAPGGIAAGLGRLRSRAYAWLLHLSGHDAVIANQRAPARGGLSAPPVREPIDRASPAAPVLAIAGVSRGFGPVTAVDDVSLELRAGEIVGVSGPNGAGKTTLLDVAAGLQPPSQGSVLLRGRDVTREPAWQRARHGLVRCLQEPDLFPTLTVAETIGLAAQGAGGGDGRRTPTVRELLVRYGLEPWSEQEIAMLSMGLRRLVQIACALAMRPCALLLDEPSAGLAESEVRALGPLLQSVRAEQGVAMLVAEHDLALLSAVADRSLRLVEGRLDLSGWPAATQPKLDAGGAGDTERATELATGRDASRPHRPASVSCADLSIWFGTRRALARTDIEIRRGDIVAILGTNGAGKSTLLRALCGLVLPTTGRVHLDDRDVTELTADKHAVMGMTLVSAQESLFVDMTVRESLSLAAHERGGRSQIQAAITEALDALPLLGPRLDARVHTLSGGEQRMLALAQAQIRVPRVLLIDELSLGLSIQSSDAAWQLVSAIHARGTTVIIVEQSLESVLSRASRAIFLDEGEILYDGSPEKLRERKDLFSARHLATTGTRPSH